jgi:aminoglycoside/choline kinase family phosphotransferase
MPERAQQLAAFIAAQGLGRARIVPIPGDASFRRYVRVVDGAARHIVMDAPPPLEDVRPFVTVARHLRSLGLSAPEVRAVDAAWASCCWRISATTPSRASSRAVATRMRSTTWRWTR